MFKQVRAFIADTFAIGHKEATGVLALLLLIILFLTSPLIYSWLRPERTQDTNASDQRKLDSLLAKMQLDGAAEEKARYGDKRQSDRAQRADDDRQTSERYQEANPFPFDPNTVSVAGWQQLGLPRWMAERIEKYRSKGGQFRKKEDLLKIYDFPPDLYETLEPYIQLSNSSPQLAGKPNAPGNVPGRDLPDASANISAIGTAAPRERYVKPVIQPFDINTADTTQLIALKGIGSKLAARIIQYRDGLGGFLSAEQYNEVYGLDSINLAELTLYAKVKSPVRKTPINTASAADLDRLPYLSRRQAEVIVNYRNQHGAYTSPESLKAIRVLGLHTIEQITPYLSF
ncbi:helix-hairpin-helix domain-containing protein [Fibrella forsythiae]|uniref:Helix-hairpin-helix domain-containing protein n=1 Tax=Fibrella forsythiae TaxID=2817061 RepID=A0ABS3JTP5_9BACT|nr:helix-hairpin-helix domain-containing protein [Fibrella forsythiae]MBO0952813.1 helix-hairpin-helix domain-containing protein [Fibrella forsythiae]